MRFLAVLLAMCCSPAGAWAQDWSSLDARTRALGGAGTAFADGRAESLYWNPAALAVGAEKPLDFSTGFSFSLNAFADAHATGDIAAEVNHVIDLYDTFGFQAVQSDFNSAAPTFTDTDVQNVLQIVDSLTRFGRKGQGVIADIGAGFDLRVGPFGLFVHALGNVGLQPVTGFGGIVLTTDPAAFFNRLNASFPAGPLTAAGQNLSTQLQASGLSATDADNLAFQAQQSLGDAAISEPRFVSTLQGLVSAGTTSLYDNPSGAIVRALAQAETGISFALPLFPTLVDVGVSFKYIVSETTFTVVRYADKDSEPNVSDRIRDDLMKDNRKRSTHFNIDLGARASPLDWLTLSLSARNLIPMTLDFEGPIGKIRLDPQVRFGAMARAMGFINVGFDVDLLENESPVLPGYTTQNFGAGLEFDLPVIKIRLGWAHNFAYAQDHGRLTAGVGLDLFGFVLDLGVQGSVTETTIEAAKADGSASAEKIPTDRVSVALTIGVHLPF